MNDPAAAPLLPWEGRIPLPPTTNHGYMPVTFRRRNKAGRLVERQQLAKTDACRRWEAAARTALVRQGIPRLEYGTPVVLLVEQVQQDNLSDADGRLKLTLDILANVEDGLGRPHPDRRQRTKIVKHKDGTATQQKKPTWNDRYIYLPAVHKIVDATVPAIDPLLPDVRGYADVTVGTYHPSLFAILRALVRRPTLIPVVCALLRRLGEPI